MMQTTSPALTIRTTNGTIALVNLIAQIDGLELQAAHGRLASHSWTELVDLLILRAHFMGCIGDYERAVALSELRAHDAPADALAFLSRARARACLHRFDQALADLDSADGLGASGAEVETERAAIFQAVGRYDEAMVLRRGALERKADFEAFGGLASLYAERGDVVPAEEFFDRSQSLFRGVSPFPLAQLEFQRGHMWREHGNLPRALEWLTAAWRRLPAYVQAEGHLAEVEAAMGDHNQAIDRLRRLATASDDPDYAAQLARILGEAGRPEEGKTWRARAEERYDELVAEHPAAFADHASEFWVSVGGNPRRALDLARLNFELRPTPRARALLASAIAACAEEPRFPTVTINAPPKAR